MKYILLTVLSFFVYRCHAQVKYDTIPYIDNPKDYIKLPRDTSVEIIFGLNDGGTPTGFNRTPQKYDTVKVLLLITADILSSLNDSRF